MPHEFLTRGKRRFLFVATLILFGLILYGARMSRETSQNRVIDWLPRQFAETQTYNWFLSHFHDGELLMVSWDGCTLDDPRQEELASRLLEPPAAGQPASFRKVITSRAIYEQLSDPDLDLSHEEIIERMKGWSCSPDGEQGCLILFLSKAGWASQVKTIELARRLTREVVGVSPEEFGKVVHIAGPSIDSAEIDKASAESQSRLLPFFLVTCVVLLFFLMRTWVAVGAIFLAAIFNEELSGALLWYTGTPTDSISMISSSLLFVLTISAGLHLTNYYRDEIIHLGRKGASFSAMRKALVPCGLACLTTVLGLFSLTVSKIVPIRRFGMFSTLALIIGTVFLILFICSFYEEIPIRKWEHGESEPGSPKKPDRLTRLLGLLPGLVWRLRVPIVVLSFAAMVFLGMQLPNLKTVVTFHGMFPKDAPIIKDYDYLEHRIGGVIPVEVVLSIPGQGDKTSLLNDLILLDEVTARLGDIPEVETTFSALNFVPFLPDPEASGFRAVSLRTVFNRKVDAALPALQKACLYDDSVQAGDERYVGTTGARLWRISLRIAAYKALDYGPLLDKVHQEATETLAQVAPELGIEGASSLITGAVPLVHQTQKQLLCDLTESYLSAFVLITISFIILLKSFWCGIWAIIPNIFPSILVFGLMAWQGIPVDMGAMMTASVALGTSVDGTFHFLTWFKRGLSSGLTRQEAVGYAYGQCATAMTQSSIICGGGMLVFGWSDFVPVAKFSWMLVTLIFVALAGDIVLFPAMLYGPIGQFYMPANRRRRKHAVSGGESEAGRTFPVSSSAARIASGDTAFCRGRRP